MSLTRKFDAARLFAVALHTGQAFAADNGYGHGDHRKAQAEKGEHAGHPYPLKVDPLGDSLVDVDKPIGIVHEGRTLHFASGDQ